MSKFKNVFSPLRVNKLVLKNRIIAAPMGGGFIYRHRMEDISARAKGGAAVVVLGCVHVDNDRSLIAPDWPGLYDPYLELYMDELNIIHQYGAKASVELFHAGLWADVSQKGLLPFGPVDDVRDFGKDADGVNIVGMTEDDIFRVVESYAQTAANAKRLGFDICTLHFAHGWLPAQFLSPLYNRRNDKYGGCFENRARFPRMIVDRVREAVGSEYTIDMRICGDDRIEGGNVLEETILFLKLVQDKIDMVNVSSGLDKYYEQTSYITSPSLVPHMINVDLTEKVKKEISIPVTTVGSITTPEECEQIISAGKADGIYLARALFADPEFPNKARSGKAKDIVPCIRCLSCYHVATGGYTIGCSVNPSFGRRVYLALDSLRKTEHKKVIIIGGGPAGMKAAITAADYGHSVILLEKENQLGGLINVAEYESNKVDLRNYRRYLIQQTESNTAIEIKLNTEATPNMVQELNPDVLIVAVGSEPVVPPIEGIESKNVRHVIDVYKKVESLGQNIVIIGGGEIGCEFALSVAQTGRKIVIIEMTNNLAQSGNIIYRTVLHRMLKEQQTVSVMLESKCKEISERGVLISERSGKEVFIEVDDVLIATGMKAKYELANSFVGIVYDVKLIGDCVLPGKIDKATYDGYFSVTSI